MVVLRRRGLTHGAQYAYRLGCRCRRCREWKRLDVAEYRARKKASKKKRTRRRR